MSFGEKIILHLCRIIFAAIVLTIVSLLSENILMALVSGLVGWLAFVVLDIFKHPYIPR